MGTSTKKWSFAALAFFLISFFAFEGITITNDITPTFILGFAIAFATFIIMHFYFRRRYKLEYAKNCKVLSPLETLENRIRPVIFQLVEEEKARLHTLYVEQAYYESKLKECNTSIPEFGADRLVYEHLELDIETAELRYKSKLKTLRSIDERIITLKNENNAN